MKCSILKAFNYSANGITARLLAAGTVEDIDDDLVPGLTKEGFLGEPKGDEGGEGGNDAPLEIMKREDGKYDVVDIDGKPINPEPLVKKAADKLLADEMKKLATA
jgi:hypothetical protein